MSKVVFITGGTSGIGKETAILLASQGWRVVISGRRQEEGDKVVKEIKGTGGEATSIPSVTTESSVKLLITTAIQTYNRLDAAVKNAGITTDSALFADLPTSAFQEMIQVNILSLFWCMKYQLQHIVPLKTGSIVNLASIAGLNGIYMTGSYAATKHAVIGLTKSAALDYATYGITVNAIAPRPVKTSILKQAIDAGAYSEEPIADLLPVKRMGELMDIARGIKFLLES